MTDHDVEREIEENQRRSRDEQDVGLEEDVLRQNDSDGLSLDDVIKSIPGIGRDESEEHRTEYDDDTKQPPTPR